MKKVIDIAHYQGKVDFKKVKKAGYDGVIIKAGGSDSGYYIDSRFTEYYEGAKNAGLNVGAYYFNGKNCLSKADGKEDAIRFIKILKGKKFDLPVYMDIEAQPSGQKDNVTDAIFGFCEELEKNGYYVGVYASDIAGFKEKINYDKIKDRFSIWVARYGSKPTYATKYQMWQYSENGVVNGINDNEVDLNECYKDFPTIIKNGGYNGYPKKKNNSEKKDNKPSFKKYYIKVTAKGLNVRENPNANSDTKIIRVLKKGEKWLIRDEKNGWGRIRIGWIKLSYTKKV